mmetsp:Transcript_52476/g.122034  ORF Transcript_52476/g.122034 Transcript_52476/m.122034 type:complete len:414 (+) Transcript_52476:51-1292(+)
MTVLMLLGTTAVCCLVTAVGLSLDSQRLRMGPIDIENGTAEARSCNNATVNRAAMCLAGNARTFGDADVVSSLQLVLRDLQADHSCHPAQVDLFAYVTLTGDNRKEQDGQAGQVNASRRAVEEAFALLNATAFQAVDEAGEITMDNFQKYVNGLECFHAGFWANTKHFVRSLNQLRHIQQCLLQVIQHEVHAGGAYNAVIITRPDMIYKQGGRWKTLVSDTSQGQMHHQKDWFLAVPRPVVNDFLDPHKSLPLTCRPGDYCCGRVARSEDMFEYITEAHLMGENCTCRRCYCSHDFPVSRRSSGIEAGSIAFRSRHGPRPKRTRRSPRSRRGRNGTSTGDDRNSTPPELSSYSSRPRRWRRRNRTRGQRNRTSAWQNQTSVLEPKRSSTQHNQTNTQSLELLPLFESAWHSQH